MADGDGHLSLAGDISPARVGHNPNKKLMAAVFSDQFAEIVSLQKQILQQQTKLEDNLSKLGEMTAEVDQKITEVGQAIGYWVGPDLEASVHQVSSQAESIDEKVPDAPGKKTKKSK